MFLQRVSQLFTGKQAKALDQLVTAYTNLGQFSGSVLVAQHGEILLRKGYGLANLEHEIANRPETIFRIGSMTKPFTALAIMQLVETGKLSTTTTVDKFLPDFPSGECITVHHLLSNTSGIPDYVLTPEYQALAKHPISTTDLIQTFQNRPLLFAPGASHNYSNLNWVILGFMLEAITGKPYATVIAEQIFQPAGMKQAGYTWEQPVICHRANGYIDTGEQMLNAELIDESTMHGAGGLYASVDDLSAWAQAIQNNRLVRAETLQQMLEPSTKADHLAYGYGWELHTYFNRAAYGHSGGLPGYVSSFISLPQADALVVILSNLGSASFSQISEALLAILLSEPYEIPSARKTITVDPAVLACYVGEYNVTYFGRTSLLTFVIENGKLTMNVSGLPKSICSAVTENSFYARSKGDVKMTFVCGAEGVADTIEMNWSGQRLTAKRIA